MGEAKQRVLVAEADTAARILLRRRLEAEGYEVEAVEDGEAALAALGRSAPDVLIVDVSLPKIDGIQVIRQLRSDGSGGNLPILALSAHGRDIVERGLAGLRGPDGYVTKPIDFRELQAKIKALVSTPRSLITGESGLAGSRGRLVAFIGAKGGVGTSSVAASVAVSIARQEQRTILVETARFHGTLGSLAGLAGAASLDQLPLAEPERLTIAGLDGAMRVHSSGMRVLIGPSGDQPDPPAAGVMALCKGLRSWAELVVVDLDSAVDVFGQVILRLASPIWVVSQPEPTSVERAAALLAKLQGWGVDPGAVGLLINQTAPQAVLQSPEIGQRVGRPVGCWIPYAASEASAAGRLGRPLIEVAHNHPVFGALTALSASLATRSLALAR